MLHPSNPGQSTRLATDVQIKVKIWVLRKGRNGKLCICAKTVPDSTKLHLIKSKFPGEACPQTSHPPSLPYTVRTDVYLPPLSFEGVRVGY